MLVVLGLIDIVVISKLLIMTIVGGYETSVSSWRALVSCRINTLRDAFDLLEDQTGGGDPFEKCEIGATALRLAQIDRLIGTHLTHGFLRHRGCEGLR